MTQRTKLSNTIPQNTPALYYTENMKTDDIIVQAVIHIPGYKCKWLVTEIDRDEELIYCYADLSGAGRCCGAEWGYTSLTELEELNCLRNGVLNRLSPAVVDNFTPRSFAECIDEFGCVIV